MNNNAAIVGPSELVKQLGVENFTKCVMAVTLSGGTLWVEEFKEQLDNKDFVKIAVVVDDKSEVFWAQFVSFTDTGKIVVRVDNELKLTEFHGVKENDELVVDSSDIFGVIATK